MKSNERPPNSPRRQNLGDNEQEEEYPLRDRERFNSKKKKKSMKKTDFLEDYDLS